MNPHERPILRYREDHPAAQRWAMETADRCHGTIIPKETPPTGPILELELPDGRVFRDLAAFARIKAEFEGNPFLLWLQKKAPPLFQCIAYFFPRLLQLGAVDALNTFQPAASYSIATRLFVRVVSVVYLLSFITSYPQLPGLVGSHGIMPPDSFPVFGWQGANIDIALDATCFLGAAAAVGLFFFIQPLFCAVALYLLYSLLVSVGGVFYAYGFDSFTLEMGVLAVLVTPYARRRTSPPRILLWYIWWLLFRLTFFPTYFSVFSPYIPKKTFVPFIDLMCQPLPTPFAWWLCGHLSIAGYFLNFALIMICLSVPFLLFCGPIWRRRAGEILLAMTLWGVLCGNNSLTPLMLLALLAFCFDDDLLERFTTGTAITPPAPEKSPRYSSLIGFSGFAAVLLWTLSLLDIPDGLNYPMPGALTRLFNAVKPLRLVTTQVYVVRPTVLRPEIIVEGSEDGRKWIPYEFKWKPGNPAHAPRFTSLYLPRLDWQFWFPFTGNEEDWMDALLFKSETPPIGNPSFDWTPNPWLVNFVTALKHNQPEVLSLLDKNPFPGTPPRHIRLLLYDYRFTGPEEKQITGCWWTRRFLGELDIKRKRFIPAALLTPGGNITRRFSESVPSGT